MEQFIPFENYLEQRIEEIEEGGDIDLSNYTAAEISLTADGEPEGTVRLRSTASDGSVYLEAGDAEIILDVGTGNIEISSNDDDAVVTIDASGLNGTIGLSANGVFINSNETAFVSVENNVIGLGVDGAGLSLDDTNATLSADGLLFLRNNQPEGVINITASGEEGIINIGVGEDGIDANISFSQISGSIEISGTTLSVSANDDNGFMGINANGTDGFIRIRAGNEGGIVHLGVGEESAAAYIELGEADSVVSIFAEVGGEINLTSGGEINIESTDISVLGSGDVSVAAPTGTVSLTAATLDIEATSIGFYNASPVAQQTGVAVTAGAIHAALVALGLITA